MYDAYVQVCSMYAMFMFCTEHYVSYVLHGPYLLLLLSCSLHAPYSASMTTTMQSLSQARQRGPVSAASSFSVYNYMVHVPARPWNQFVSFRIRPM
jgi:hypothetical protein